MGITVNRRLIFGRKSGRLPIEYQEVESIISHGREYINTELIPIFDVKAIAKISIQKDGCFFGGYQLDGGSNHRYDMIYTENNIFVFGDSAWHVTAKPVEYNTEYLISSYLGTDLQELIIDGSAIHKTKNHLEYGTPILPMFLFARSQQGSIKAPISCTAKQVDIYINEQLMRNYIPCYRKSDGVIGMYDLCSSVCSLTNSPFYINAGTGAFTKGADV